MQRHSESDLGGVRRGDVPAFRPFYSARIEVTQKYALAQLIRGLDHCLVGLASYARSQAGLDCCATQFTGVERHYAALAKKHEELLTNLFVEVNDAEAAAIGIETQGRKKSITAGYFLVPLPAVMNAYRNALIVKGTHAQSPRIGQPRKEKSSSLSYMPRGMFCRRPYGFLTSVFDYPHLHS